MGCVKDDSAAGINVANADVGKSWTSSVDDQRTCQESVAPSKPDVEIEQRGSAHKENRNEVSIPEGDTDTTVVILPNSIPQVSAHPPSVLNNQKEPEKQVDVSVISDSVVPAVAQQARPTVPNCAAELKDALKNAMSQFVEYLTVQ